MNSPSQNRRQFLIRGMVSLAAIPFAGALISTSAMAQALKPLPANNASAIAVAASKGCNIFPGFAVAPAGWCSAWAKKA